MYSKKEYPIDFELIDLVSLSPIDYDTILNSAKKTGRVVIINEENPNENLGEYYIAPFLNDVCQKGKAIKIIEAKDPKLFGNIEELLNSFRISFNDLISENAWSGNQRKTLVVDIDGTLCLPPENGDYNTCKPIKEIVHQLHEENNKGTYIIPLSTRTEPVSITLG